MLMQRQMRLCHQASLMAAHPPETSWLSQVYTLLTPGYFLLWLKDYMMEACILLAGETVHKIWQPQ